MKNMIIATSVKLLLAAAIAFPVLQTANASATPASCGENVNGLSELKKKKKKKKESHSSNDGGSNESHGSESGSHH
jgi:hypothetical protein